MFLYNLPCYLGTSMIRASFLNRMNAMQHSNTGSPVISMVLISVIMFPNYHLTLPVNSVEDNSAK